MKNVLYVGNALSNKGKTVTPIETLSSHLKEICHIKVASKRSNKIARLLDMMALIIRNKSKVDLVLIDTYSTQNFYYALTISLLCRAFKIEYVPILHGGNLEHRLKNNPTLCASIFNNAKCLVSPSKFLKSKFEDYGYNNVVYIPNCIEIDNYEFQNRQINTISLLWVRSFSEIYNPELAILVLQNLIEKGYNSKLTMVGPEVDGSLSKVRKLAKQRKLKVEFTGKLSKKDWRDISKSHNIFINTTNFDNMPVSLIEAMALGLPIVSTNVGGIPHMIGNNTEGLLVEPKSTQAMVDAIIHLKENPELKNQLVKTAREKAENFDWYAVKRQWQTLIR